MKCFPQGSTGEPDDHHNEIANSFVDSPIMLESYFVTFGLQLNCTVQGHKYASLTRPSGQNLLTVQHLTKTNCYLLTITSRSQNLFPDVHHLLMDPLLSFP